jgi:hypothetical protein
MPQPAIALVEDPPAQEHAARVRAQIAVLERALDDGLVTFHDVAAAWFLLCDDDTEDDERARLERLYPELRAAFEAPRGGIITACFCEHVRLAAALTDIRRAAELGEGLPKEEAHPSRWAHGVRASASSSAIHLESRCGEPEDEGAKALLYRCVDLHYRALEFLTPKPRKICMRMAFAIISAVLGELDDRAAAAGSEPLELTCLQAELAKAEAYYERSAQRQAQLTYFAGMSLVTLVFVLAAGALALALPGALTRPLPAAALAGAAGAVVSVLFRMSRGQLGLNHEFGGATVRLLGGSRTALGALLGAAVYVLLSGGILPMPQGAHGHLLAFFAGSAFLAGFTERLIPDAVGSGPGAGRARAAVHEVAAA